MKKANSDYLTIRTRAFGMGFLLRRRGVQYVLSDGTNDGAEFSTADLKEVASLLDDLWQDGIYSAKHYPSLMATFADLGLDPASMQYGVTDFNKILKMAGRIQRTIDN
jgi:hypothetical protein